MKEGKAHLRGELLVANLVDGMKALHGQLVNINPHPLTSLHFHAFFILIMFPYLLDLNYPILHKNKETKLYLFVGLY